MLAIFLLFLINSALACQTFVSFEAGNNLVVVTDSSSEITIYPDNSMVIIADAQCDMAAANTLPNNVAIAANQLKVTSVFPVTINEIQIGNTYMALLQMMEGQFPVVANGWNLKNDNGAIDIGGADGVNVINCTGMSLTATAAASFSFGGTSFYFQSVNVQANSITGSFSTFNVQGDFNLIALTNGLDMTGTIYANNIDFASSTSFAGHGSWKADTITIVGSSTADTFLLENVEARLIGITATFAGATTITSSGDVTCNGQSSQGCTVVGVVNVTGTLTMTNGGTFSNSVTCSRFVVPSSTTISFADTFAANDVSIITTSSNTLDMSSWTISNSLFLDTQGVVTLPTGVVSSFLDVNVTSTTAVIFAPSPSKFGNVKIVGSSITINSPVNCTSLILSITDVISSSSVVYNNGSTVITTGNAYIGFLQTPNLTISGTENLIINNISSIDTLSINVKSFATAEIGNMSCTTGIISATVSLKLSSSITANNLTMNVAGLTQAGTARFVIADTLSIVSSNAVSVGPVTASKFLLDYTVADKDFNTPNLNVPYVNLGYNVPVGGGSITAFTSTDTVILKAATLSLPNTFQVKTLTGTWSSSCTGNTAPGSWTIQTASFICTRGFAVGGTLNVTGSSFIQAGAPVQFNGISWFNNFTAIVSGNLRFGNNVTVYNFNAITTNRFWCQSQITVLGNLNVTAGIEINMASITAFGDAFLKTNGAVTFSGQVSGGNWTMFGDTMNITYADLNLTSLQMTSVSGPGSIFSGNLISQGPVSLNGPDYFVWTGTTLKVQGNFKSSSLDLTVDDCFVHGNVSTTSVIGNKCSRLQAYPGAKNFDSLVANRLWLASGNYDSIVVPNVTTLSLGTWTGTGPTNVSATSLVFNGACNWTLGLYTDLNQSDTLYSQSTVNWASTTLSANVNGSNVQSGPWVFYHGQSTGQFVNQVLNLGSFYGPRYLSSEILLASLDVTNLTVVDKNITISLVVGNTLGLSVVGGGWIINTGQYVNVIGSIPQGVLVNGQNVTIFPNASLDTLTIAGASSNSWAFSSATYPKIANLTVFSFPSSNVVIDLPTNWTQSLQIIAGTYSSTESCNFVSLFITTSGSINLTSFTVSGVFNIFAGDYVLMPKVLQLGDGIISSTTTITMGGNFIGGNLDLTCGGVMTLNGTWSVESLKTYSGGDGSFSGDLVSTGNVNLTSPLDLTLSGSVFSVQGNLTVDVSTLRLTVDKCALMGSLTGAITTNGPLCSKMQIYPSTGGTWQNIVGSHLYLASGFYNYTMRIPPGWNCQGLNLTLGTWDTTGPFEVTLSGYRALNPCHWNLGVYGNLNASDVLTVDTPASLNTTTLSPGLVNGTLGAGPFVFYKGSYISNFVNGQSVNITNKQFDLIYDVGSILMKEFVPASTGTSTFTSTASSSSSVVSTTSSLVSSSNSLISSTSPLVSSTILSSSASLSSSTISLKTTSSTQTTSSSTKTTVSSKTTQTTSSSTSSTLSSTSSSTTLSTSTTTISTTSQTSVTTSISYSSVASLNLALAPGVPVTAVLSATPFAVPTTSIVKPITASPATTVPGVTGTPQVVVQVPFTSSGNRFVAAQLNGYSFYTAGTGTKVGINNGAWNTFNQGLYKMGALVQMDANGLSGMVWVWLSNLAGGASVSVATDLKLWTQSGRVKREITYGYIIAMNNATVKAKSVSSTTTTHKFTTKTTRTTTTKGIVTTTTTPRQSNIIIAQTCAPGKRYDNPKNCCCAPPRKIYKTVAGRDERMETSLVERRGNVTTGEVVNLSHLCAQCPSRPPSKKVWCCKKRSTVTVYKTL